MSSEMLILIHMLDEAFDRKAWHGPNMRGSVRGVSAEEAARRPAPGRHNIWEIVLHVAYWKYAVRRRLAGGKRGSFPLKGSNWFVRDDPSSTKLWAEDIALLLQEHRALREAVSGVKPSQLFTKRPGSAVSHEMLIRGIAAHDLYHAGQIQLLKRLVRGGAR